MTGKELKKLICNNMKKARESKGLTRHQLSDILGVESQQIYTWECGKAMPRTETFVMIADALKVDVFDFFKKGGEK